MSTSLIYHAFGARSHNHLKSEYRGGAIYLHVETKRSKVCCAACRSPAVVCEGRQRRKVRGLPIGQRPVFLVCHLRLLRCETCGALRQERRRLANPRKSYTRRFARFVLDLAERMTLSDVAEFLGVSWSLVKGIVANDLLRRSKRRSLAGVKVIAIDEFAIRKGHKYATAVVDLHTGQVLFCAEGKDHSCLEPFFTQLAKEGVELEAVAIDMGSAFIKAVRTYAPGVPFVFDRYHVVAKMNEALDNLRRREQRELDEQGKKTLKGGRYLLLWGWEKLEAKGEEKVKRLEELLKANANLSKAYLLKEDLRLFWQHEDKETASCFVDIWIEEAKASKIKEIVAIAKTIERCKDQILAWYDHRITTGPLEGLNNKIKVLKRRAYGYRDMAFFLLRVLFIHETRFRLSGV